MSNSERNGKETSVRHELWSDKTMTVLEKKERREVVKKGGVRITFSLQYIIQEMGIRRTKDF